MENGRKNVLVVILRTVEERVNNRLAVGQVEMLSGLSRDSLAEIHFGCWVPRFESEPEEE